MQLIEGRILAEKIKDGIVAEVHKLGDQRPNLAIVLVGERPDSKLYVGLKEREAKKVGIDTHTYNCEEAISEDDLLAIINYLNKDDLIDAILLQLPLPVSMNEDRIVAAIDPNKDVDGFHPDNFKKYLLRQESIVSPVVPEVVAEMLRSIDFAGAGKNALVVAKAQVFSQGMASMLESFGLKVGIVKPDDFFEKELAQADVLVSAAGKAGLIDGRLIKAGAVVIDIGINKNSLGHLCGDVDHASLKDKDGYITPVPGGVGPMTIAVALRNALKLYLARKGGFESFKKE
jgi:methylenetetrahydrofolate dehydrogenase (NADP+)/methenyltetrahydrofolate cyclohydrolase